MAVSKVHSRSGSGVEPGREPAFEKMIKALGFGSAFALPGALCAPVFGESEHDGLTMRVLMSIFWISTDSLKNGVDVHLQAALSDLRHASGFSLYNGNAPVRVCISKLRDQKCTFSDGVEIPVFHEFDIVKFKDLQMAQWRFHPDFAELFVKPPRFAILDMRELGGLTKGIDVFLYRQAMLVKNMRRPDFRLPSSELYKVCGIDNDLPFKRVVEKIKRSLSRVVASSAMSVDMESIQERGSRALAGLAFHVRNNTTSELKL
ncbi:hypothetical protein ACOI1H_18975 [Loktanella sp. DJP18]|uniref:hypothetical protein n=1 Tax=Loktanella sp. DJP18 TaxID=3409788 RepID=UPI003BB59A76